MHAAELADCKSKVAVRPSTDPSGKLPPIKKAPTTILAEAATYEGGKELAQIKSRQSVLRSA